ncbi:MAG: sulfatase [bacterium]
MKIKLNRVHKIIFILLLILIGLSIAYNSYTKKTDYNILLISIDALRADHLGCYGYSRNTSPHIDAFAHNNLLFKNFFTVVPKTGPSMTTFFTGKYIQNHGVVSNPLRRNPIIKTLPQLLPKRYVRAGFVTNLTLNAERGYADGFDEYTILDGQKTLTSKAIQWLGDNGIRSKFFLWVHYIDPHGPYTPPDEFHEIFVNDRYYNASKKVALDYTPIKGINENYILGAVPKYQRLGDIDEVDYYIAQYDAEIKYTDSEIGKLLHYIEAKNLTQNTIIIITADHGESLDENNYYFEHGMLVNEGSIHIPLIISHPDVKRPCEINSLLQNTDLAPTILNQCKVKFPTAIDGIDFSQLFLAQQKSAIQVRNFIYSCTPHEYLSFFETIRTSTDKLIRKNENSYSFYDIRNDSRETKDLYLNASKTTSNLIEKRIGEIKNFGVHYVRSGIEPKLSKEQLEKLKTLGYVQ